MGLIIGKEALIQNVIVHVFHKFVFFSAGIISVISNLAGFSQSSSMEAT